jgi:hypothetical protein
MVQSAVEPLSAGDSAGEPPEAHLMRVCCDIAAIRSTQFGMPTGCGNCRLECRFLRAAGQSSQLVFDERKRHHLAIASRATCTDEVPAALLRLLALGSPCRHDRDENTFQHPQA